MALHRNITGDDIHVVHTWTYADETARLAADSFVEGDVGKIALQESDTTFWILIDYSTPDWTQLGGGEASGALYTWTYADTATREAATGFAVTDIGKVAWQLDDDTFWMLSDDDPIAWVQIGGGSSPSSSDPIYNIEVWL